MQFLRLLVNEKYIGVSTAEVLVNIFYSLNLSCSDFNFMVTLYKEIVEHSFFQCFLLIITDDITAIYFAPIIKFILDVSFIHLLLYISLR